MKEGLYRIKKRLAGIAKDIYRHQGQNPALADSIIELTQIVETLIDEIQELHDKKADREER